MGGDSSAAINRNQVSYPYEVNEGYPKPPSQEVFFNQTHLQNLSSPSSVAKGIAVRGLFGVAAGIAAISAGAALASFGLPLVAGAALCGGLLSGGSELLSQWILKEDSDPTTQAQDFDWKMILENTLYGLIPNYRANTLLKAALFSCGSGMGVRFGSESICSLTNEKYKFNWTNIYDPTRIAFDLGFGAAGHLKAYKNVKYLDSSHGVGGFINTHGTSVDKEFVSRVIEIQRKTKFLQLTRSDIIPVYHTSSQRGLTHLDPIHSKVPNSGSTSGGKKYHNWYGAGVYFYRDRAITLNHAQSIANGKIHWDTNPKTAYVYQTKIDRKRLLDPNQEYSGAQLERQKKILSQIFPDLQITEGRLTGTQLKEKISEAIGPTPFSLDRFNPAASVKKTKVNLVLSSLGFEGEMNVFKGNSGNIDIPGVVYFYPIRVTQAQRVHPSLT